MDPNSKPYRTGMMTVLERYPCGKGNGKSKGRMFVYYLCKCDCGKEFIVGGDELSKHPYSCGCTPKPQRSETGRPNGWAFGYDKDRHTMACMLKQTRAVYATCKSGVSGVAYILQEKKTLGGLYHLPAGRTLFRLIQDETRSYRSKNRRREEILLTHVLTKKRTRKNKNYFTFSINWSFNFFTYPSKISQVISPFPTETFKHLQGSKS